MLINIIMFVLLGLSFLGIYYFALWCLKLIDKDE